MFEYGVGLVVDGRGPDAEPHGAPGAGPVGAPDGPPDDGPPGDGPPDDGLGRIDRIVVLERQAARVQAELAGQVAAHLAESAGAVGERGVAAEVALARGVSVGAAESQLRTSRMLVDDVPRLFDLVHRGEISWAGAAAVCRAAGVVDAVLRAEMVRRLAVAVERGAADRFPLFAGGPAADPWDDDDPTDETADETADETGVGRVAGLVSVVEMVRGVPQLTVLAAVRPEPATTGRLARAARRLVGRLDPAAAAERAARAREARGVQVEPGRDAELVARLPGEQAAACWQALDHHARGRRGDGDRAASTS